MQYGDVKIKLLEKDDRLNFSTFFFFLIRNLFLSY